MAAKQARRISFVLGLMVILALYCFYYLGFVYHIFLEVPLRVRHIVKLLFVLLVYSAGFFALRKDTAAWMMKLWHILYAAGIGIMLLMGGIDWWVARLPASARSIADALQEFLVSPVLYIAMGLLRRSVRWEGKDDQRKGL